MKNLLLAIPIAAVFFACKKTETTVNEGNNQDSVAVADSIKTSSVPVSKNQVFLDKFRTIVVDSSLIASPSYEEYKIGPPISKEELALFPKTLNLEPFWGSDDQFQAYAKFEINPDLYGLIARMPGEYSFTAMKLFFYDKQKDEILPQFFELADRMGDAGYSEETKSWLINDKNGQLKSFMYHWTKVEKVEPGDATRESRTEDYYLITLNPEKMDTVRVSKSDLPKFRTLLGQK